MTMVVSFVPALVNGQTPVREAVAHKEESRFLPILRRLKDSIQFGVGHLNDVSKLRLVFVSFRSDHKQHVERNCKRFRMPRIELPLLYPTTTRETHRNLGAFALNAIDEQRAKIYSRGLARVMAVQRSRSIDEWRARWRNAIGYVVYQPGFELALYVTPSTGSAN